MARRHIGVDQVVYIGKESNLLEDVQTRVVKDPRAFSVEYRDARRDEWAVKILPMIRRLSVTELIKKSGLSRATIQAIRAGRRPHPRNERLLVDLLRITDRFR